MVKKVFFILIILLICYSTVVQAATIKDIMQGAENFIKQGSELDSPISDESLKGVSDIIYNVLLVSGIIIAIVIGIVLGIKFVTGSVEQKSKIKESLIPYIVGCVIIFGAFGIWKMVVNIGKDIENTKISILDWDEKIKDDPSNIQYITDKDSLKAMYEMYVWPELLSGLEKGISLVGIIENWQRNSNEHLVELTIWSWCKQLGYLETNGINFKD